MTGGEHSEVWEVSGLRTEPFSKATVCLKGK